MKKIKENLLEKEFLYLQEQSKKGPLSIKEILLMFSNRWQFLLILLISIPFCFPLQIPGFSTPFGIMIAFIGITVTFGSSTWLPKRMLNKKISSTNLQKITNHALLLIHKVQKFIHPRLIWLCRSTPSRIINGILIFVLGILLALPLPIPFSNMLAAFPLLLISLGLLNDDGLFVLFGYLVSLVTFAFFASLVLLIKISF